MTNAELREIAYKLKDERERCARALDRLDAQGKLSGSDYLSAMRQVYITHNGYVNAVARAIDFIGTGISEHEFRRMANFNFGY